MVDLYNELVMIDSVRGDDTNLLTFYVVNCSKVSVPRDYNIKY